MLTPSIFFTTPTTSYRDYGPSCDLALSSASARAWEDKIKNAQKAHYTATRFVHRFNISGHEAHRINQRITHLKTLLDELK